MSAAKGKQILAETSGLGHGGDGAMQTENA